MEKTKNTKTNTYDCMFYSRVLKEPFESIEALKEAEEAYYAKLKAKEDKVAEKKADALKVEDAFKALNAARKTYKEKITQLTTEYTESLTELKKAYEAGKTDLLNQLATAEDTYAKALKAFTDKYNQFHLTLRDGDFETTISSQTTTSPSGAKADDFVDVFAKFFNLLHF